MVGLRPKKRGVVMRLIRAIRGAYYEFKDRLHNVDVYRKYGTRDWAQRHPRTEHDVEAPLVNANVYIATRAISDAIKGLPGDVVTAEVTGRVEREVELESKRTELSQRRHEADTVIPTFNPR